MKCRAKLFHQFHDSFRDPSQFLWKVFDGSCQEDEQLSKSLVFFHGITLDLIELDSKEIEVVLDICGIESGVVVDFDADLL